MLISPRSLRHRAPRLILFNRSASASALCVTRYFNPLNPDVDNYDNTSLGVRRIGEIESKGSGFKQYISNRLSGLMRKLKNSASTNTVFQFGRVIDLVKFQFRCYL